MHGLLNPEQINEPHLLSESDLEDDTNKST